MCWIFSKEIWIYIYISCFLQHWSSTCCWDSHSMITGTSPLHIDGLVQERRNSSAIAMELRLSCTNPSISWLAMTWLHQELAYQAMILTLFALNELGAVGKILIHWGRVTHICVGNLTIIGSDNGSWPDHRQVIIWISAGILLIGSFGTNFSEIYNIFIQENAFESVVCRMAAIMYRPQCVKVSSVFQGWFSTQKPNMAKYHITLIQIGMNLSLQNLRCDMAFIEPMHCNKSNITYLLTYLLQNLTCSTTVVVF